MKKSIVELKNKMGEEKEGNRDKIENELTKLEQKNSDLKKRLNDYKADQKFDWKLFKIRFNLDMQGVDKAHKNFSQENMN